MSRALPPTPPPPERAKRGQTPFGAAVAAVVAGRGVCRGRRRRPSAPATHPTKVRVAPFAFARQAVVRYVRRREPGVRLAAVRVHLTTLDSTPRSETVLATVSARLGRRAGTTWVDLGQRALVLRRDGDRVRVAADLTHGGRYSLLQDGVAGMPPHSRFTTGRRVVVVSAPGVPAGRRGRGGGGGRPGAARAPSPLPAAGALGCAAAGDLHDRLVEARLAGGRRADAARGGRGRVPGSASI